MKSSIPLAVASPSFAKKPELCRKLQQSFSNVWFCPSKKPLHGQSLVHFLKGAHAAVIGTERLDANLVEALPDLKFIAKYGVGMDNLDSAHLQRKNIGLGYTPGTNRLCVAELALQFALGLCHNVFYTHSRLLHNRWVKNGGHNLSSRVFGILGAGNVGSELLRLLQPFQCRTLICDLLDKKDLCTKYQARQVDFCTLLQESEILSLHIPLNSETEGLFHRETFACMRSGAFLINTARSGLVQFEDLLEALRDKQLAGAALDVWPNEPREDLGFLKDLPVLYGTPHIGGNSHEASLQMGEAVIDQLRRAFCV